MYKTDMRKVVVLVVKCDDVKGFMLAALREGVGGGNAKHKYRRQR